MKQLLIMGERGLKSSGEMRVKCVCIWMYTLLMLKDHRIAESALRRNAEMKFEMNLLCKVCFTVWKRAAGLLYFTSCALCLSFLFAWREPSIVLEAELRLDLEPSQPSELFINSSGCLRAQI